MLRRSKRLAPHSSDCACEKCMHLKGYPTCTCEKCVHQAGWPVCRCDPCAHRVGHPACWCLVCVHRAGYPMCSCVKCLHENDPDSCVCPQCVRGRHGLECTCKVCIHAQGYPVCHCFGCCVNYGMPLQIAKVMAGMTDGVLDFMNAKWLTDLPQIMPVGLKELILDDSPHLCSIPTLPEGLEVLRIDWPQKGTPTIGPLPSTLQKVEIVRALDLSRIVFPEGLKELIIYGAPWETVKLPEIGLLPHLRVLKLIGCMCHQLPPLPNGLKELDCSENWLSHLPPLPPLQRLNVQKTYVGRGVIHGIREGLLEFNHDSPVSMEQLEVMPDSYLYRMRGIWEKGVRRARLTHMYGIIETIEPIIEHTNFILAMREIESRTRCMTRTEAIRRDLMEAAWHPRRIAPLIEAGWDVEDL